MITELAPAAYQITFSKPGYVTRVLPATLGDCGIVTVGLESAVQPLPPVPSRERICGVNMTFQGLTVQTQAFGALPWFEAALTSLSSADRQAVYAAKHKAGDTHCIVALTWNYDEPNQPYNGMGRDLTSDLPAFAAIVREVIIAGFTPIVMLGGDGQTFSDVGWTYGYTWLMNNLAAIVKALGELAPYCLFCPGWDGVFGNFAATWQPSQIAAFGQLFRSLLPAGHLALEFSTGYSHLGGGSADYMPGAPMSYFDVILSEYDQDLHQNSCWQINARLEAHYVRPPDQPAGDDPHPPFYLAAGTLRGPYYHCAFEWDEYPWVRSQISAAGVQTNRDYLKAQGCAFMGDRC